MTNWITEAENRAAAGVREILDRPLPEDGQLGVEGEFSPWDIFPSIYGSYSSAFDECALDVLCEIRDKQRMRDDLAADMFREMLCVAKLCDYGTSPRVCFSTQAFEELLPELIEKWNTHAVIAWGENWR